MLTATRTAHRFARRSLDQRVELRPNLPEPRVADAILSLLWKYKQDGISNELRHFLDPAPPTADRHVPSVNHPGKVVRLHDHQRNAACSGRRHESAKAWTGHRVHLQRSRAIYRTKMALPIATGNSMAWSTTTTTITTSLLAPTRPDTRSAALARPPDATTGLVASPASVVSWQAIRGLGATKATGCPYTECPDAELPST